DYGGPKPRHDIAPNTRTELLPSILQRRNQAMSMK
ncbi:hypothetical protein NPIL_604981, partial [Nephila pilipes]